MSFRVKLYIVTSPEIKIDKPLNDATNKARVILGNYLEDVQDVNAPFFEFDGSLLAPETSAECDFWTCNYAYVPDWNKYYFITDKTIVDNDHVVLRFRLDVLKTYASAILSTNAWISRSASAGSWYIPDGNVPMSSESIITVNNTAFSPFSTTTADNTKFRYVVMVAGGTLPSGASWNWHDPTDRTLWANAYNSVIYYAMRIGQLTQLAGLITSGDLVTWFDDSKSGIFSVMQLPFDIDVSVVDTMQIGSSVKSSSLITAGQINHVYRTVTSDEIIIPTPADFRIATGDAVRRLWLPAIGWYQIDPAIAHVRKYCKVRYKTNVLTGATTVYLYLYSTSGAPLVDTDIWQTFECQLGRMVPLTLNNASEIARSNASAILSSALALGGAIASQNPAIIAGSIASTATGIANSMLRPVTNTMAGSVTGAETLDLNPNNVFLQYITRQSPVLDGNNTQKTGYRTVYGLPCEQFMRIDANTGYIKCANWWMTPPANATERELQEIKNHMENGVIV